MHHFDAISQKISGGGPPDPHLREGVTPSPTLPLSALRASVKPSASFVICVPPPAVEVLNPPLQNIDNFLKYMLVLNRPTSRPRLRANFSVCR